MESLSAGLQSEGAMAMPRGSTLQMESKVREDLGTSTAQKRGLGKGI